MRPLDELEKIHAEYEAFCSDPFWKRLTEHFAVLAAEARQAAISTKMSHEQIRAAQGEYAAFSRVRDEHHYLYNTLDQLYRIKQEQYDAEREREGREAGAAGRQSSAGDDEDESVI